MKITRLRSWLPSRYDVLGASVILDIVTRLPEDLIAPLISITGGIFGSSEMALLTTWFMFAVALYNLAPLAYSYLGNKIPSFPNEKPGIRIIFTIGSVLFGNLLGYALPNFIPSSLHPGYLFISYLFVGFLFLVYLSRVRDWDLFDPQGKAILTRLHFTIEETEDSEFKSQLNQEDWVKIVGSSSLLLTFASVIYFIPTFAAAVVLLISMISYPLPDFIFLGWAISYRLFPRLSVGPNRNRLMNFEFDFEKVLIDSIENTTRGPIGMNMIFFIFLGIISSVALFSTGSIYFDLVSDDIAESLINSNSSISIRDWLSMWNLIGGGVLIFFAIGYGIWAWIRELYRLPHYLDTWDGKNTASNKDLITRPPGFNAISIIAFFLHVIYVIITPIRYIDSINIAFGLLWPFFIIIGIWSVQLTHSKSKTSQSVEYEHIWIFVGFSLQLISLAFGSDLLVIIETGKAISFSSFTTVVLAFYIASLFFTNIGYYYLYDSEKTTINYLYGVFLILLGIVLNILSSAFIDSPPVMSIFFTYSPVILIGLGIIIIIKEALVNH
ncbi:hypothetical protein ACEU6E_07085 [Halorutilales archaeon Cl-col2-1]